MKKEKWFDHPWWHTFFTSLVEYGSTTVLSPNSPKCDYTVHYCSKCDSYVKNEKWRKYL